MSPRMRFLTSRLAQSVVVVIGVTIVAFFLLRLIPGDAVTVILGDRYTPVRAAQLRGQLGLDDPLWTQYGAFMHRTFSGDLGSSIYYQSGVASLISARLPVTLWLAVYATTLAVLISVPLALASALRKDGPVDQGVRVGFLLIFAMPPFWVGLILVLIFGVDLGWFPVSGYGQGFTGHLDSLFLPSITIALGFSAILVRTLRASIVAVLEAGYVDTARAKGLSRIRIINRHVLRNALISAVSVIGVNLAYLIGGAVIIENVFSLPGLGSLLARSITTRDIPVVQGTILVFGIAVVVINLLTDVLYAYMDPRVSYDA